MPTSEFELPSAVPLKYLWLALATWSVLNTHFVEEKEERKRQRERVLTSDKNSTLNLSVTSGWHLPHGHSLALIFWKRRRQRKRERQRETERDRDRDREREREMTHTNIGKI